MIYYTATRSHGLEALALFAAGDGTDYLRHNDIDFGPDDKGPILAAYLRHRLLTDEEATKAVLANFSPEAIAVFLEEIADKSYARGWLARHPGILRRYLSDLLSLEDDIDNQPELRRQLESACSGCTGIACFDAWADEVVGGCLHRRSQRAFASIWVFTLKLPWQSGANYFMRHLIAADLADVLLVWREVTGLEDTPPYCVTNEDIAELTARRFTFTSQLASSTEQVVPEPTVDVVPRAAVSTPAISGPVVLLVTCDDLHPESWPLEVAEVKGVLLVEPQDLYGWYSDQVISFKLAGLDDAARRLAAHFKCPIERLPRNKRSSHDANPQKESRDLCDWFEALDVSQLIAMTPGAGQAQDDIAIVCQQLSYTQQPPQLKLIRRPWDHAFEAAAGDGRAAFVDRIADVIVRLGLNRPP